MTFWLNLPNHNKSLHSASSGPQQEWTFTKPLARCTLYSMHAIVQAFHDFPSKESLPLTEVNFIVFLTGSFLFFKCISSENSESDKRLNARRFNSTFTALSATFTHSVAINHWRFTHKQISQWFSFSSRRPTGTAAASDWYKIRFIAQHKLESFFLEQEVLDLNTVNDKVLTFCWWQGQGQAPHPSSWFSLAPPLTPSCPWHKIWILAQEAKTNFLLLTLCLVNLLAFLINLGLDLLLTEWPPVDGRACCCLLEKLLQTFCCHWGWLLNASLPNLKQKCLCF